MYSWGVRLTWFDCKKGFVENIGQSGPLLVVSKTQGKCQLSVNPIQTLLLLSCLVIVVYNRPL